MIRVRILLVALSVFAGVAALSQDARAQFVVTGPGGSLGISNGNGSYTYIYPDRLNPYANQAVPGSMQQTPNGPIWLGQDGQVHGNLLDPTTGDIHVKMAPGRRTWPTTQPSYNRPATHSGSGHSGYRPRW